MPCRALLLLMVASLAASGCRTAHEASIRQRLPQQRFFAREFPYTADHIDAALSARRFNPERPWCELCLLSSRAHPDGSHTWCLSSREEQSCFRGTPTAAGGIRFAPVEAVPAPIVVRSFWFVLDPGSALFAEEISDDDLATLAWEEEEHFSPRWSFTAGARAGAVVSFDPTTFTFGASAGVRYWGSPFVVPGATLEVENMLQSRRSLVTLGLNGRIELSLWTDENARWFNTPRVSFTMGTGPIVAFGQVPALGGRVVFGVQLNRVVRFPTPFFFEFGYQALDVDKQSASGLRVAVGLGF